MEEKVYPMTLEGKAKLEAELEDLKVNKRKEIVEFDEKCGGWYVHKQADTLADVLFKQHNEEWQIKQNYTPSLKHKVRIIGNIYENHELTQTTS